MHVELQEAIARSFAGSDMFQGLMPLEALRVFFVQLGVELQGITDELSSRIKSWKA